MQNYRAELTRSQIRLPLATLTKLRRKGGGAPLRSAPRHEVPLSVERLDTKTLSGSQMTYGEIYVRRIYHNVINSLVDDVEIINLIADCK